MESWTFCALGGLFELGYDFIDSFQSMAQNKWHGIITVDDMVEVLPKLLLQVCRRTGALEYHWARCPERDGRESSSPSSQVLRTGRS